VAKKAKRNNIRKTLKGLVTAAKRGGLAVTLGLPRKPEKPVTPEAVLRRAIQYKPRALAIIMIGLDGKSDRMWCARSGVGASPMLELAGAAFTLTDELSWNINRDTRAQILPRPPKPKRARPIKKKRTARPSRRK